MRIIAVYKYVTTSKNIQCDDHNWIRLFSGGNDILYSQEMFLAGKLIESSLWANY